MMTTIGNEEDFHEIKVKSISIVNRLIKLVAIEKKKAIELQQLEKLYRSGSEVRKIEPNVVYICKIQRGYERCCAFLEGEDNLAKSLTVFFIDCDSEEAQVSLDQLRPIASSSVFSSSTTLSDEYYLAELCVSEECKRDKSIQCFQVLQDYIFKDDFLKVKVVHKQYGKYIFRLLSSKFDELLRPKDSSIKTISLVEQSNMIGDYVDRKKKSNNQQQQTMRPIARNLKAPAPPKFVQECDGYEIFDPQPSVYRINVLPCESIHQVRVAHLDKGINLFYIQLAQLDSHLQVMTTKIQTVQLKPLRERPSTLGMACLAKYQKKIYRVAVGKPNNDTFLCHFVDFGFSSHVKFDSLYCIPNEFVAINAFAIAFCFIGLKNSSFYLNTPEVNYLFQQLTENKLLTLRCVAPDGPPRCQYCELYDSNKANILESLKRFNPFILEYPPPVKIELKKQLSVKVCYVFSTNEFYVQNQDSKVLLDYDMVYYELQQRMINAPVLPKLKIGLCCGISIDGEWFRGKIVGVKGNEMASVQVLDFGIIEDVAAKNIRLIASMFFTAPPFAFRCCLKGFENLEVSENINTQFDIFCSDGQGERRVFKMLVDDFKIEKGYIVELEDESVSPPANVNRILLKNSRPLAETITLENAKKRQKEASVKRENNAVQTVLKEAVPPAAIDLTKEIKSPDRNNRNSSQRGRGNHKGTPRVSSSAFENDKRQRTHFGKQADESNTFFKTPKEATSKLNTSNSSSSFESNWRESQTQDNSKTRKSKSSKSPEKKKRESDKQKVSLKREKSTVDEKTVLKKAEKNQTNEFRSGWVSTLCSLNKAFVHLEEHVDGLSKIMNNMDAFYGKNAHAQSKNIKNGAIYAFLSADSNFYRGEIKQIKGKTCQVQNLEYGNIELIPKDQVFDLVQQFAKEERFVCEAYFPIKAAMSDNSSLLKEMNALFRDGSQELKLKFIKEFRSGFLIEIMDTQNENFFDKLVSKKLAVRVNEEELSKIMEQQENFVQDFDEISNESSFDTSIEETTQTVVVSEKVAEKEITVDENKIKTVKGKITALTSPNDFYLSSLEALENYQELHNNIQCIASSLPPLLDFECQTLCSVQDPFDNSWYRAKIIDSDETIITVLSIDNGKTFSIDNKISLKVLPEQWKRKSYGMACSLPVSIERKSEEEATAFMLTFVDLTVDYEIVLSTSNKTYVEVSIKDENLSDFLVKKKLAKRFEIFQVGPGYTSHINSLDDFYIQLEADQLKLDLILTIFDRANGKFEKLQDPSIDQIVAVKYNEDQCWYRGKIESIECDGYMVKFLDYGNLTVTKDIGILDESISRLPAMSKKCRLSKPKNILNFSEAAEKKFLEICDSGSTILEVKVVKPGDVTEIELFYNGQNIIELLAPLCTLHENTDDY